MSGKSVSFGKKNIKKIKYYKIFIFFYKKYNVF